MAFLLCLQDVEKLSATLQPFCPQIIIEKMGNLFEVLAFQVKRSVGYSEDVFEF
jgi:hypothetical protein